MMRVAAAALLLAGVASGMEAWPSNAAMPVGYAGSSYGQAACTDATLTTSCCCATGTRGGGAACLDVELLTCFVKAQKTAAATRATSKASELTADGSQLWIILCGALVFFMQCGFAMLEVGAVRTANTLNIIFKNLMDACIGALGFYTLGYAFAYGPNDVGHFLGASNFFLMKEANDEAGMHSFFFQFAFAATAATIVSGSVAERTKLSAYFVYSLILTVWVYPVVVHWVWSVDGWLSAFAPENVRLGKMGMIDYAGSGVVHTVGGFAGLCGAYFVGPRKGRFSEDGEVQEMPGQSAASHSMLSALGVLILWFGWYGFNCGSTLAWDGENAGKVATTTTLSAAAAALTATLITHVWKGVYDLDVAMNCILAGLVSITAGCSVVDEWCAVIIGMVGGVVYMASAKLLLVLKIDDPLNAWPVHGACGVWGCLAVGIFAQHRNILRAYGHDYGDEVSSGMQFAVQLAGVTSIVVWTVVHCVVIFGTINLTFGMRVPEAEEVLGLDKAEHGSGDWARSFMGASQAKAITVEDVSAFRRASEKKEPTEPYAHSEERKHGEEAAAEQQQQQQQEEPSADPQAAGQNDAGSS